MVGYPQGHLQFQNEIGNSPFVEIQRRIWRPMKEDMRLCNPRLNILFSTSTHIPKYYGKRVIKTKWQVSSIPTAEVLSKEVMR